MRVYTVHENSALFDDRRVVLVKEGFSWPVFFLALVPLLVIIWAIYRRVWLGLLIYFVGVLALGFVEAMVGADRLAVAGLNIVYALLAAAEANDWRRRSIAGRGYREVGVVIGENLNDAEHHYFSTAGIPYRPRAGTVETSEAAGAA